jgi:Flp pilus assembly pilin Flp
MTSEANVNQLLGMVWREESGQDLIEYTLLIAFIVFLAVGVLTMGGGSITGIVKATRSQLTAANSSAGM